MKKLSHFVQAKMLCPYLRSPFRCTETEVFTNVHAGYNVTLKNTQLGGKSVLNRRVSRCVTYKDIGNLIFISKELTLVCCNCRNCGTIIKVLAKSEIILMSMTNYVIGFTLHGQRVSNVGKLWHDFRVMPLTGALRSTLNILLLISMEPRGDPWLGSFTLQVLLVKYWKLLLRN